MQCTTKLWFGMQLVAIVIIFANIFYGSATNKNNFSSEACSEVAICGLKSIQSVKVFPSNIIIYTYVAI